ncbi:MAG TPA: acetyl-CoA carboxylase biotin carboxyl carrier protein [Candidatus Binatia bacterium]|nr:acetyl-CoA carboxylase biotin carboxyl carrier protein [Candidatus Binatia bacterium]
MELKDIKAIIDLMKKNSITEFELEEKDSKLRLKRGLSAPTPVHQAEDSYQMLPVPMAAPANQVSVSPPAASAAANTGEIDIKSPMIGTFYRSPSPESASYVEVGTEVNPEAVVCIIEAMKVMNEIKSEVRGVVTQILVENGKPVEFGQALFKVRPA